MAGDLSNYAEGEIIKHIFRTGSFTKPTSLYVALFTTMPDKESGTGGTEVSGGSYARVQVGPSDATWDAPTVGGDTANTAAITFPAPTANWGTILGFGVYDASTSGNMLFSASLTASKTVNNGDPAPNFPIGDLTFTLD